MLFVAHVDLTKIKESSKSVDYWKKELNLFPSDKHCIESGGWLNDNIIMAAQVLMQRKYPQINGLQTPILGETLAFDVHVAGSQFVQVLNVSRNHWIMVTSIGCDVPNQVKVYDSLPSMDVPWRTKQQIASLLFSNCHEIKLLFPNVQLQQGSMDCGLFALAFSVSLCAGQDPSTTNYIQNQFRNHLLSCLEASEISPFPTRQRMRRVAKKLPITSAFDIYCICRLPGEGRMIECEQCREWFHKDCVDTIPANWRKKYPVQWFCANCECNK